MNLNTEILELLKSKGVDFSLKPADVRELQKHNKFLYRRKRSIWKETLTLFVLIAIFIGYDHLTDLYPSVLTWHLFVGFILGIAGAFTWILIIVFRTQRQARLRGAKLRTVGVENDILWVCQEDACSFFTSLKSFERIDFVGDYIFAYIEPSRALIFVRKVLMETDAGKAVHAWLARAR